MEKLIRRKILIFLLVLGLLTAMLPPVSAVDTVDFTDVPPSHWAFVYIRACARAGYVSSLQGTEYAPDDSLTVGQLVTFVGRALYGEEALSDTKIWDTWYSPYVRAARRLGLLEHVGETRPSKAVRRCDMAMFLYNVMTKLQEKAPETSSFGELLPASYDVNLYAGPIGACYSQGLMGGYDDGLFHGEETVTRAQAAKMIALLTNLELQPLARTAEVRSSTTQLYILMYHSVVDNGTRCGPWTTNVSQLRKDLQWLADHGYTAVLPSELARGELLPEKAVMITFDDGYADNYTNAYPILKEYGAKAVISPIVERVEDQADTFLTWDMCREMANSGLIEFGSHTYDLHDTGVSRMTGESVEEYEERVFTDILKSKELLESRLGKSVLVLAYPHGTMESWAASFVRANFRMTLTTVSEPASIQGGLYDLSRYNASFDEPASMYLPD